MKRVLIANRGEIALRIQRACKELGIKTVSIASSADANSYFARQAEELVVIGPPPPKDSYLAAEKIVATALERKCDAVHPGYGFLSENAEFARKVNDAGLIFIGPSPEAIKILGDKTSARERVSEFGVPCTPGTKGQLSDHELVKEASEIGFPVIIKAAAGGGGRGMRIVRSAKEMEEILPRARAEAKKNFADDSVYAERYIEQPRHVEVQIMGDTHGDIVHLGTRDCSTQRRHQKLIEEAPAPGLTPDLRAKIHQAAVSAGRSVNYINAGTVEFLVKGNEFYFLEVNTRIQVEHPVTEAVTGVDLVKLQLHVAMGQRLPFSQEEINISGHAVEFRIYAEDPLHNFRPVTGKLGKIMRSAGPNIREDFAFEEGDEITPYYDAMISKFIVKGETREETLREAYKALRGYSVQGLPTNLEFHRWLLKQPAFLKGALDIGFIEREFNAESIRWLQASEIVDPRHRPALSGAENKDLFHYHSKNYKERYTIEIVHRSDQTFLARALSADGRCAQNRYCRISNGLETALQSVITVLEETPPQELFQSE